MTPDLLYRLEEELAPYFSELGHWQLRGMLLGVLGLLAQSNCHVSVMAEQLPAFGSANTVKTRLKRWLSNPRLDLMALSYAWMKWVLARFKTKRPIFLVDETKLGEHLGVMMVSLAYKQRAIPLMWRCYIGNSASDYPQQGQVLLIYGLLSHVLSVMPVGMRPLIQMDRGLGHSSAMLKALQSLPVDYLLRVKSNAYFTTRKGCCRRLMDFIQPGTTFTSRGTLFKKRPIHGYIRLIWEPDQTEPWCLFTNLPWLSGQVYAMRWWQEESFKDFKSGGWQWGRSKLRCPHRMTRLLFIMVIAYVWMLSLGTQLSQLPQPQRRLIVTRDEHQRLSVFRLGYRWFKYLLAIAPQQLSLCLVLKPPILRLLR